MIKTNLSAVQLSSPSRASSPCAVLQAGGGLPTQSWRLVGDIRLYQAQGTRPQVTTITVTGGCSVTATLRDNTTRVSIQRRESCLQRYLQLLHSAPCSATYSEQTEVIDKHETSFPHQEVETLQCQCGQHCSTPGHSPPPAVLNLVLLITTFLLCHS